MSGATSNDGIPLPDSLSGVLVTRTITIDSALLFLINGAMTDLLHYRLEQTGTLTVEDARQALFDMYYAYLGITP